VEEGISADVTGDVALIASHHWASSFLASISLHIVRQRSFSWDGVIGQHLFQIICPTLRTLALPGSPTEREARSSATDTPPASLCASHTDMDDSVNDGEKYGSDR
jgi:hypothetical protein